MFCKEFFALQIKFAELVGKHCKIPFEKVLFSHTSLYTRLIGYHDEVAPNKSNPKWQEILRGLPKGFKEQTNYIYQKYLDYEKSKPKKTNQKKFGCFAFSYHEKVNRFELHFSNSDPKGNLGKDRVKCRIKELKELFTTMKSCNKKGARVYLTTWLLGIEAFNRLYPPAFIKAAKPWTAQLAQNNAHWGQFVDRHGSLKKELAKQLLCNASECRSKINDYFPLPCFRSEVEQAVFYDFYF